MSLLEINNLRVVYPNGTEALKSVSFAADEGEIIAVIGRSGAGKSTLLRCINGLQPPTEGDVILDGANLAKMDEKELIKVRRQVGFIWQEYNLVDRLSVMTNVLTGRLGYNNPWQSAISYFNPTHRQIAMENLERVNLLHKAKDRADQCSGGEKQRISIARALSQNPKVVLADEPVASLDPELAWQVLSDLARVAREVGVLTLMNLHNVEFAKEFTERVIGIAQGTVVYDGPTSGLNDIVLNRIYRFDRQTQLA
jgi:phosphonate transport system ATP-binding protein